MDSSSKRIYIAGGSGFLGTALSEYLTKTGFSVEILPRVIYQNDATKLAEIINASFAIINLAGASISKRWTKKYMAELINSRMKSTRTIVEAIEKTKIKPKVLLSASATGIYEDSEIIHDENSKNLSTDFLGQLAQQWEKEAMLASEFTRVNIMRFGVILGKNGGIIKKLKPVFRWMLGGKIGSGKQFFPYVHIEDACRACLHIIQSDSNQIKYNIVAPEIIDNKHFTKAFANACNRKTFLIIPKFALKLILGKGARFILSGQKVIPAALEKEGFKFQYGNIWLALENICK